MSMAAREHRKRGSDSPLEQRERPRKSGKMSLCGSGEVSCPICEVTLWPKTVEQHYHQELQRLSGTSVSLAHSKKRRKEKEKKKKTTSSSSSAETAREGERDLFEQTQQVLDSVRRNRILFNQKLAAIASDLPRPSSEAGPSGSNTSGGGTCPVCDHTLPPGDAAAQAHVDACLRAGGDGTVGSSDDESFEEYTWCNVTRVRATSMLSPQARANMFGGSIISKVDTSMDDEVDVEDDETALYGPPQFDESDVISGGAGRDEGSGQEEEEGKENKESESSKTPLRCQICMDGYHDPLISIKCWHVYCDKCWLQALGTKKVCPKCKDITSAGDLRKIFL